MSSVLLVNILRELSSNKYRLFHEVVMVENFRSSKIAVKYRTFNI